MTASRGQRQRRLAILLCGLAAIGRLAAAEGIAFEWIQRGDVVQDGGVSAGLAWGDYDDDGRPDLFIANWRGQPNLLYHNRDGELVRVAEGPVANARSWSSDGAWGDYDGDGDLDLFVANQDNQHNELYRNDGEDGFARIEQGDIVSDFGNSYAASWGDYDGDGRLDLVVANSGQPDFLYRNRGEAGFERVTEPRWTAARESSHGVSWADYDDDGDLDLFVATYAPAPNLLYRNEGGGRLVRVTAGPIAGDAQSSLGGSWGDWDNDGDLDLFVANSVGFFAPAADRLYRNDGAAGFTAVENAATAHLGASGGSSWADVDLDGDLDLLVVEYAGPNRLYLNDGRGGLEPVAETFPLDLAHFSTGHGWADVDDDGDLDVAMANWQGQDNNLFGNPGSGNHWLRVRLRTEGANRRAVGATIRLATRRDGELAWQRRDVTAGTSFRSQQPADQTFGLGAEDRAAELVVAWPSGGVERLTDLAADATLTIVEGQGVVARRSAPASPPPIGDLLAGLIEEQGVEAAMLRYRTLRAAEPEAWDYGPGALSALTLGLVRGGKAEASIAVQELAVAEHPRSGPARQLLFRLYGYLGRTGEADRALAELVDRLDELEGLHPDELEGLRNEAGFRRKHLAGGAGSN